MLILKGGSQKTYLDMILVEIGGIFQELIFGLLSNNVAGAVVQR